MAKKKLPFQTLKKTHFYEAIADEIQEAIFDGRLKPGDKLPSERELSESFGVGRPTIREAMRRLEMMGLIKINVGLKGSVVKEPDIAQFMSAMKTQLGWLIKVREDMTPDFWEIHSYIELGVAHSVSRDASKKDLARLDRLIKKMEACSDDIEAYLPVARDFHQQLALMTKNRAFYLVWDIFQDIIGRGYAPIWQKILPKGPKELLDVNKRLLEAIKSKDPDAINQAMEKHARLDKRINGNRMIKKGPEKKKKTVRK